MSGHMVIIGGGKAGSRAAVALRENGFDGAVTLVTVRPMRPMTGRRFPRRSSPMSKFSIRLSNGRRIACLDKGQPDHRQSGSLDRQGNQGSPVGGSNAGSYDKLLIATGALPRKLPLPGADLVQVRTLRTYEDAMALRDAISPGRHVVIIGGGFIGLEVASSDRKRGADVTLIEGLPRVLSRGVPEEVAAIVTRRIWMKASLSAPLPVSRLRREERRHRSSTQQRPHHSRRSGTRRYWRRSGDRLQNRLGFRSTTASPWTMNCVHRQRHICSRRLRVLSADDLWRSARTTGKLALGAGIRGELAAATCSAKA